MDYTPHPYQMRAIELICQHEGAALFLDPGMGKTSIALAAVLTLRHHEAMRAALVVAPLRPARLTWAQEAAKWAQLRSLRVVVLAGLDCGKRTAGMQQPADVYVINPEQLPWIVQRGIEQFGTVPDMLIVDESTKFKNSRTQRYRALEKLLPRFSRRVILTGTPAPQSIEDLFGQMKIIDDGARLGRYVTQFRRQFMTPELVRIGGGRTITKWTPAAGSDVAIARRIADVSMRLQAEDYLQMPRLLHNTIPVALPPEARRAADQMTLRLVADLQGGEQLSAGSAAAAVMKLRQITNGIAFTEDGGTTLLHTAKLDALADLIEEQSGQPLLVAVAFVPEVQAIRRHLGDPSIPYLGGGVSGAAADRTVELWNRGELPVLLAHPASVAHGLNLQAGGSAVCWFGLTWSLEEFTQFNARVYRQGQHKPVVIHYICALDTVDQVLVRALKAKANTEAAILAFIKEQNRAT